MRLQPLQTIGRVKFHCSEQILISRGMRDTGLTNYAWEWKFQCCKSTLVSWNIDDVELTHWRKDKFSSWNKFPEKWGITHKLWKGKFPIKSANVIFHDVRAGNLPLAGNTILRIFLVKCYNCPLTSYWTCYDKNFFSPFFYLYSMQSDLPVLI